MTDGADATMITRVLVVDDSVVVRRLVSEAVEGDPRLQVAGTAANGRIALAKIAQVSPDVVTLDVEMPELDGLETLARIRASHPRLPVIMFSTRTERGAGATVEALLRGADDYVTKPTGVADARAAVEEIRAALVPKILATRPAPARVVTPSPVRRRPSPAFGREVDVVVVAVSTGGPNALAQLVPALPADLGVPVLVVQHMPPMFTRLLADRLDQHSALDVREGWDGAPLQPGHVWIAPGGRHMVVRRHDDRTVVGVTDDPPENSCRPAADVLLRSAVETYGDGVLGVVLTGMGQDGLRGARAVVAAGGSVIAQDRASSVVWGMPGAVVQAGLADEVVSLDELSAEILTRVHAGGGTRGAMSWVRPRPEGSRA